MAGESARDVARRHREKAARLERSAARWEQGAAGEEAVASALAALPPEWTVVDDVRWPDRRFANIDHVVVGPGGVFVIDAKNWSGTIAVVDNVLSQNGRQREAAVAGGADSATAVAVLASVDPTIVHPVLCFAREEWVAGWARDVMVCSTFNLVAMLGSRPVVLVDEDLASTRDRVIGCLRPAARPASSTVNSSRQALANRRLPTIPPKRSRGRTKSTGGLSFVGTLLVGLVLMIGLPRLAPVIADVVTDFATDGLVVREAEVGSSVTVPGDSNRPDLRVATVSVRAVTATDLGKVSPMVVRVEIENDGSTLYRSGHELRMSIRGDDDSRHVPDASASGLGRAIERGLKLRPGESISGRIRFQLPAGVRPVEVRLVVGTAPNETVDWSVPT